MFSEPRYRQASKGWIEVVCGCMFSGKTEELIRRLRRAQFAGQTVEIFKPRLDVRYDEEEVVSHNQNSIRSTPIDHAMELLLLSPGIEVVGIDEAQFFDLGLVEACQQMAARGSRVILAGLDMDYLGQPFEPMPQLMAVAEYVTKVHAICMQCGDAATHSYRHTGGEKQVELGEKDAYEARCRSCFNRAGELPPKVLNDLNSNPPSKE
jgi:thymidine kinase